jgi:hypothetical protein
MSLPYLLHLAMKQLSPINVSLKRVGATEYGRISRFPRAIDDLLLLIA